MNLPENLQHFAEPTLILIGNFGKTTIYLAHEIEMNDLQTIEGPEPSHQDSESSVVINGGRRAKTDTKTDDGELRKKYTKDLTQTITDLVDDRDIKQIQLIMPAELIRRLKEDLSNDITDLISKTLDKDLTKTDLVEALERLQNIPTPIK